MTSRTICVSVFLVLTALAGCESTSGGGSQTNWIRCHTDNDCTTGSCVQGNCRSASDSRDSGVNRSMDSGSNRSMDSGSNRSMDSGSPDARAPGVSSSGELGQWTLTADYPLGSDDCTGTAPDLYCAQQTCVASAAYVYCVGGNSTSVYYSKLSSTGLGSWSRAPDYPMPVTDASCVVGSDAIYCVGGRVGGTDGAILPTSDVYYAPLSSAGIGAWTASTAFPHATSDAECMASSGYIYCIAPSAFDVAMPEAYFAPISSSGVGAWVPTVAPPTYARGCSAIGGYAYCFGGGSCPPNGPQSDCYSPSYFAPLAADGIGAWKATSELPTAVSAEHAVAGNYIYYLSTPVFYASASADGIGPWKTTTNYPGSTYAAGCFSNGGYLYCAGPGANSSYFTQVGVSNPHALQLEDPPPFPRSEYLGPAWVNGGGCSVTANGVFAGAPCFDKDIDEAVIFDCASDAKTAAGCKKTVVSSNAMYDYDMTIWYPCPSKTGPDTNCCFLPSVGYAMPFDAWCSSVGSNSFIIADQITLRQSQ